jgi:hypothetical protein
MEPFRRNLSENIFCKTAIFQNGILHKESFRNDFLNQLESFRKNLSECNLSEFFLQNRNLSEWNLLEGIFQKIFLAKPESCKMESFRRNHSGQIFQKESFRKYFPSKPEPSEFFFQAGFFQNGIFQKEYFRRKLSEKCIQKCIFFSQTEIFQNGIFQKQFLGE